MKLKLKLSCKNATELIEKQSSVKLNWLTQLKLQFHLMVCKVCHSYYKQSKAMDFFFHHHTNESCCKEDKTTLKSKIITQINNH